MNVMEHIHLAGEDEDDLYGGFNDYNATLDTFVNCFTLLRSIFWLQVYECSHTSLLSLQVGCLKKGPICHI